MWKERIECFSHIVQNTCCCSSNRKSWRDQEKLLATKLLSDWYWNVIHGWVTHFQTFEALFLNQNVFATAGRQISCNKHTAFQNVDVCLGKCVCFWPSRAVTSRQQSTTTAWRPTQKQTTQKCPSNYDTSIKVDLVEREQTGGWHETNALRPMVFSPSSSVLERLTGQEKHSPRKREQHTKKKEEEEQKKTFPAALLCAARGIFKRAASNMELRQNFSEIKFRP